MHHTNTYTHDHDSDRAGNQRLKGCCTFFYSNICIMNIFFQTKMHQMCILLKQATATSRYIVTLINNITRHLMTMLILRWITPLPQNFRFTRLIHDFAFTALDGVQYRSTLQLVVPCSRQHISNMTGRVLDNPGHLFCTIPYICSKHLLNISTAAKFHSWRFGVVVTRWSRSTQLLYIEPG